MVELNKRFWIDFDWPMLLASLMLVGCGTISIFSSAPATAGLEYWKRQLIAAGMGLVAMTVLALIDYRRALRAIPVIYLVAVCSLLLPLLARSVNGAQAWIEYGSFKFQPSEIVKIATIAMLAYYLAPARGEGLSLRLIIIACGIAGLPIGLIILQNDLGTALTFFAFLGVMLFVAGLRWSLVIAALVLASVAVVGAFQFNVLSNYQRQRIEAIINPSAVDPRGYGYQTLQSKIAVGSGGVLGKGVGKGTQSQLRFLPEPHTDFIAAVFAEEIGFLGILTVLGLYVFVLTRALRTALTSRDRFGRYFVVGFVALLTCHVLANLLMVVGLLPVLGIPLPLMSYGGSSILATFVGIGLTFSVRLRRFVN